MRKHLWWLLLGLIVISAKTLAVEYPKLTSWVNDYANILSSSQQQELDVLLSDFETATTNQIFVCIMRSLPADTTLEEYSNELFERWQPGQKNHDTGALLAIFIDDRELRIESGYGLEDTLTDAASKLIIANDITPEFKQGDYHTGIQNGLIAMMRAIQPGYQPKISTPETIDQSSSECGVDLGTLFTMIIVLIIIFNVFSRRRSGGGILRLFLNLLLSGSNVGWGYGRRSGWQPQSRHRPSYTPRPSSGSTRRSSSGSRPRFSGGGGGRSGGGGASGRW